MGASEEDLRRGVYSIEEVNKGLQDEERRFTAEKGMPYPIDMQVFSYFEQAEDDDLLAGVYKELVNSDRRYNRQWARDHAAGRFIDNQLREQILEVELKLGVLQRMAKAFISPTEGLALEDELQQIAFSTETGIRMMDRDDGEALLTFTENVIEMILRRSSESR